MLTTSCRCYFEMRSGLGCVGSGVANFLRVHMVCCSNMAMLQHNFVRLAAWRKREDKNLFISMPPLLPLTPLIQYTSCTCPYHSANSLFIRCIYSLSKSKTHEPPSFAPPTVSRPPNNPFIVAPPNSLIPLTPTPSNHLNTATLYSFQSTLTPPSLPNAAKLFCVIGPACLTLTLPGVCSSASSSISRKVWILKAASAG